MRRVYRRKRRIRRGAQFKMIQLIIIVLSVVLMVASFKDASSSVANYRFNGLMMLIEFFLVVGVMSLEDYLR